jgi:hypothetical protein
MEERLQHKGLEGLRELPGVGEKIAGAIEEIVQTGRLRLLDTLEAESLPGTVFTKLPGVGKTLAARIRSDLGIETLEELERAAYDGRLERVSGVGRQLVEGIRNALAGMLSRSAQRDAVKRHKEAATAGRPERPPVSLLLEIDTEYRDKAEAGELRTIAPRRFNPEEKEWLPVMDADRQGWSITALFSNTALAHELGKTHDWVVIYYEKDDVESQCTVVTAGQGSLKGRRVVRGRERECRQYYEETGT